MARLRRTVAGRVGRWVEEPMLRVVLRARLLRRYRTLRFRRFGRDSILHRPDWVYRPRQIEVGDGVIILGHAWLAVEKQAWELPGPVITIGNRVGIRPYCTISAAESIVLEDNVILSAFSTVIDSDHSVGPSPNVLDNPLKTSPVRIGEGTWIGERSAILRGAQIGRHCVIGANSVVRGEIPDYSIAVGAPARVVGSTREGEPGIRPQAR